MRRQLVSLALAVSVASSIVAPTARADEADAELQRARALMEKLRYREASAIIEELIEAGGASPASLADLHRLAGELLAGLGDSEGATLHFSHYLALVPTGSIAEGTSPKLADPFNAARDALAGRSLSASVEVVGDTLEVVLEDPTEMARAVTVRFDGGARSRVEGRSPVRFPLPETRPRRVTVIVLDEHGNQLVVAEEALAIARATRPVHARPTTWAIAAGAAGALTLTFGLLARSAQSELDDLNARARTEPFSVSFDEIRAVEDRARRDALVTNIGIGLTGAAAVTAITLWWLQRERRAGESESESESESLEPTVSVGGRELTIGARLRF